MDLYIMNKDIITGKWMNNRLEIINKDIMPLYLINTANVPHWLETRAIDSHRANSRLLKKALRLKEKDDISTAIAVNGVTITDTYWVKPIDSALCYNDVKFDSDYFAKLALTGSYDSFTKAANSKSTKTPELTNIGSYEKCWRLIKGKWYMYKKADHNEMFSELFVFKLGRKLGMNMAEYERGRGYIKTKDFTNNGALCFEPAYGFMGDNDDYIDNINALEKLSPRLIKHYFNMLFLDTVTANPDRHTFNYGILRDCDNGNIVGFAPNFDNNMALISRGYPKNISRNNDVLIKCLNELLEYKPELKKYIPAINEELIYSVLNDLNMRVKSKSIAEFIMNGYRKII